MSTFLVRSACRGHAPEHISSARRVSRPALIAKLLRERHVARVVAAPDGFGKTNLAMEYAETVFAFRHVFWVDAASPCFLRDLDDGCIARVLGAQDDKPFLLVLEDVPPLDAVRAAGLSGEIDLLLERGCEVLITCTPSCDVFDRQLDRVRLTGVDLLLSDAELDALRMPAECAARPAASVPAACRVAALEWAEDGARARFLDCVLHEELPDDVLLALFAVLVLQEGELRDVEAFVALDEDVSRLLAERYPYLGIDLLSGSFAAAPFSAEELASAFSGKIDQLARRSAQGERDAFVLRAADGLMARRGYERACDLVRLLASAPARFEWLRARGEELTEGACLLASSRLYRSLEGRDVELEPQLAAGQAVRLAVLECKSEALSCARRAFEDESAPLRTRAVGALVGVECGESRARRRAKALLEELVSECLASQGGQEDGGEAADAGRECDLPAWAAAAQVRMALGRSYVEAAALWLAWHGRGVHGPEMLVAASWVLRRAAGTRRRKLGDGEAPGEPASDVERMAAVVRTLIDACEEGVTLSAALAAGGYEQALESRAWNMRALDAEVAAEQRRVELALFDQRKAAEEESRARAAERLRRGAPRRELVRLASHSGEPRAVPGVPKLTVNLFGGLDVRIGGLPIDSALLRRTKTQSLLAVLTINRGNEVSREQLLELLWPGKDPDLARRYFYTIWSDLRRALTAPSGTCPYLLRRQQGYRLDPDLLESDVEQLEDVCRTLLFERPGFGGWAPVYDQVQRQFADELVPGDTDCPTIASARVSYRNRLVDALVAASRRLVAAGDVQEGLWFARAALQRDRSREDAYDVLMRAQVAAGQRAAALDTYFSCRRFLADELGIDPAVETVELYRSIITAEEVI